MSSGLTVVKLREALRKRNLDATGLKADLVARLDDAIAAEAPTTKKSPTKKRAAKRKGEEEDEDDGDDAPPAPKRSKADEVKRMTVVDLRAALSERQLATTGRKNDLVERLIAALESDVDKDEEDAKSDATAKDQADDTQPDSRRASARGKEKEGKKEREEEAKMVKAYKKGRAVLDEVLADHIKSSCHVLEEGDDVYDAMLNQTNVGENNNKYYKLQVLESDDNSQYFAWFRWGRVGYKGQNQLHNLPREGAKREFEKKFYQKTRNNWRDRSRFVSHPQKYTLLEMDYEEEDAAKQKTEKKKDVVPPMKKQVQSKLDSRVAQFVSLICDLKMMRQQMVEIGYDARKMPLGKLSKATILKGYQTLKSIQGVLESRGPPQTLLDLSSEFYTLIPHDFGFQNIRQQTINTIEKLKKKIEMVEALGEIAIAAQVLEEDDEEDDPAFAHYKRLKCKLEPLDQSGEEFKMIQEYLKNTHGQTHRSYDLILQDVFKVQRDEEDAGFRSFSQTPNRMLLWHGSRLTNWTGILSQGLRIAPPEAPSTGYMFGKGVYFADMVSKSANYCFTTSQNPRGVLLLCEVALGQMNELYQADYNANRLPPGKLSTKGLGRSVPNSSQFKTLPDGVVVPLGKPVKSPNSNTSLEYNEYIVYDTKQIRMRYVLQVDFQYKLGRY
ncbi:poly [ADP-ribose] polymerase 2 [Selaginella moellendorffii]|uniref:poly [ADP-ribose] polymerase 2 n=1 Tax=Selaginella moellendorffii TaxID=88036 RepID=UPI000D1CAA9F|nr:poly [ADP-ribose] polymerase 2 [Selaginella moellendorffii]|eukprot:XP_024525660.1 poly [ADP-ribose] polymerase 2 [Selaginella moellendorffii]